MNITRYGITLERLKEGQIELVRTWRNDQKISSFMFYKGVITSEMQQEWFASIDNEQNFFFLIHYKNQPVGLINISSIDWENRTAYSGLFIYDDKFIATDVPVRTSLAMLDVFFLLLGIETVFAKVKGTNDAAHNYNSSLGFVKTKKIEFGLGDEYMLSKAAYLTSANELRNAAIRLNGNKTIIVLNVQNKTDEWLRKKMKNAELESFKKLEVEII